MDNSINKNIFKYFIFIFIFIFIFNFIFLVSFFSTNCHSQDYMGADWDPIPSTADNHTNANRDTDDIDTVVIHTMEGPYGPNIGWWTQNPASRSSPHYAISRDGEVTQLLDEEDIAWHAGNGDVNRSSIGIELEGFVGDPDNYTDEMLDALDHLLEDIGRRNDIPLDRDHVIGHNEVPDPFNPGLTGGDNNHTDPGDYWDWTRVDPLDNDGDGLTNEEERILNTDPENSDTDGDGLDDSMEDSDGDGIPDLVEISLGTDPTIPDSHEDSDGDGISNRDELINGTDPNNSDSDGDGVSDRDEDLLGTDPTNPNDSPLQDPGGDNPDDYEGVISDTYGIHSLNPSAKVILLRRGFCNALASLLKSINVSYNIIDINFSPDLANNYPLLIIPSGGLYGLTNSLDFKIRLEQYLNNGGTILVLAQQHGYEYESIPGGIKGYGWTEDQSCYSRSLYIDTYHQVLSGQSSTTCSAHVDGYFTNYPEGATILLRRTKNGMPALLTYTYGNGRVFASATFTDWAYSHSSAAVSGIRLIRDISAWGVNPEELPEYRPNVNFTLPINLINNSDVIGENVKLIIRDPDGEIKDQIDIPLVVNPGDNISYDFNYTSSTPLGIWTINYILWRVESMQNLGEFDLIAQKEQVFERFVVSNPPAGMVTKSITFSVTSPGDHFVCGADIPFTIHIWNHGDEERSISFKTLYKDWWLRRVLQGKEIEEILNIPPHEEASFLHLLSISDSGFSHNQLNYYAEFYDEDNRSLGSAMKMTTMIRPYVGIDVSTDKGLYYAGEEVLLTLDIKNKKIVPYTTMVNILVLDHENIKVYEEDRDVALPANDNITENVPFTLPGASSGGAYIVLVEAYQSGQKIGSDSCYFTVPEAYMAIIPHLPGILGIGNNIISFDLELFGLFGEHSGTLEVSLKDPTGATSWTEIQDFTVTESAVSTLDFELPIDEILFGSYSLAFQAAYGAKTQSGTKSINSSPLIKVDLDQSSYRVRDTMGMEISINNEGKFQLDSVPLEVNILDIGYSYTDAVTLAPGQSTNLVLSTRIADTLTSGNYTGTVALMLGNNLEKDFTFTIPNSRLAVRVDETAYNAGDNMAIIIENPGGVDTEAEYQITLTDNRGISIQDVAGRMNIQAGVQRIAYLNIPDMAVNGTYQCTVEAQDLSTFQEANFTKVIDITGLSANLDVSTSQQVYNSGDIREALADIEVTQGSLEDGTLNLKAIHLVDQEKTWTTVEDFESGEPYMVWILEPGYVVPDDPFYPDLGYNYDNPDPIDPPLEQTGEVEEEPTLPEHPYIPEEPEGPEEHNTLNTYGDYLRIGIDSYGHLGDYSNYWGFGYDRSGSGTGFYETVAKGWWGDGYVVGYNSSRAYSYESNPHYNMSQLSEIITENADMAQVEDITQSGNLNINQTFTLDKRDKYLQLDVVLTNTGTTTLTNVSYVRVTDWDIITGSDGYDYLMDSDNLPIVMAWQNPGGSPMYCGLAAGSNTPNTSFDCDSWGDYTSAYALDNYDSNGRNFDGCAGLGWDIGDLAPGASYNLTIYYIAAESKEELIETYNRADTRYYINLTYDAGRGVDWTRLLWTSDVPEGTDIRLCTRTAETEEGLADAAWSAFYDASGATITSNPGRFIEIKAILEAEDPKGNPPYLHDVTVQYISKDQVWEKDLPVNVLTSDHFSTLLEPLGETGRFLLEGTLYSHLSQFVGADSTYFYIDDGDIHLTFEPDRKVYKPGQTITISGQVIHEGSFAEEGLDLIFTSYGSTLYSEILDMAPGESHSFNFTTSALDHTFSIYASLEEIIITEQIEVEVPALEVNINSPEVVGRNPFDFTVILKNPGRVDVDINLTIAGDSQSMTIPGGERRVVNKTFSTTTDLTISVVLSGDITDSYTKEITFGEDVQITFDPDEIYPQGAVGIPYTIENTGLLDTSFDLEISVDGSTTTRNIFVAQGDTIADILYYDLTAGSYTLSYGSFFDSGSENFKVALYNDLAMNLDISYGGTTPSVLILKDGGTEVDLASVLTEAGMEVTVSEVFEYQWNGTNPDPTEFDVVILVNGVWPSYGNDMPSAGQAALVDFVNNGGGLLMTEWMTYESRNGHYSTMSDLVLFEPSQWNYQSGTGTLTVVQDHPITEGLPSSFGIPYHAGNRGGVKAGVEVIITGSTLNNTVAVKEYGAGHIVQYAVAGNYEGRPFIDDNMKKLLINSVQWASGGSGTEGQEAIIDVDVENLGYNDFVGRLNVSADFLAEGAELILDTEEKKTFSYSIDLSLIDPGTYIIVSSALSNGIVIQETTGELTIAGPLFELTGKPENPVYVPGEEVTMAFTVQNNGQTEGEAELHLTVLDLLDDTKMFWIAPGAEAEFTFTFLIPDDLPEKEYKAILEFNGETIEIPFRVQGIKIAVSASLDKTLYNIGDIALLTLDITNEGGLEADMWSWGKSDGNEDYQEFTLTDHQVIELTLPIDESTQDKIFYGIYLASGRAVYLNSIYIRVRRDILTLYTDKGVYNQGETVTVFVQTTETGTLSVDAPGFEEEVTITGDTTFSFTLPDEMVSSSYAIEYQFGEHSGTYFFDVVGYSARILECRLDRSIYDPIDEMTIILRIEVNRDIPSAFIRAWIYDPQGNYNEFFEVSQPLNEGENLVQIQDAFSTPYAQMHQVVYGVYKHSDELLLTSGAESFDVTEAALTALNTDKDTYDQTETAIAGLEGFVCEDFVGELQLFLDGAVFLTEPISWIGYQYLEYNLDLNDMGTGLGNHLLEAQIISEGEVVSRQEMEFMVIDSIPPEVPTGLTYSVEGTSVVLDWDDNTEPDLAGYNLFSDGEKINVHPIALSSYWDEGLAANQIYIYTISAVDVNGNESGVSADLYAVLDTTPPTITLSPSDDTVSGSPVTVSYAVSDNFDTSPSVSASYPSPTTFSLAGGAYTVTVTAQDDAGNSATRSVTITIDTAPPTIWGIKSITIDTGVTIMWETDKPCDSQITYGLTTPPTSALYDPTPVTSHSVSVSGLAPNIYCYQVTSTDAIGHEITKDNDGSYYWFDIVGLLAWWPQSTGDVILSSPLPIDLDNDGILEIVIGSTDGSVYAWHEDGTEVSGWPQSTGADSIESSPTAADLDGDGSIEIVIGADNGNVYAWHAEGTLVAGWPQSTGGMVKSSATLIDLDGVEGLEVIIGSTDGNVYVWHADGSLVSGWPQSAGAGIISSSAVADLDQDGTKEVVIGSQDGQVYAWHSDGTSVLGWPKSTGAAVNSSPALVDFNGDGSLEVVAGSDDGNVYVWTADGSVVSGWPKSIAASVSSSPAIGDLDIDGIPEIVVGDSNGYLYAWHADGSLVVGWPQVPGTNLSSSPAIGDTDGDGFPEVIIGSDDGWVYTYRGNGTLVSMWPTGDSISSSPAIIDINADTDVEVLIGSGSELYIWDCYGIFNEDSIEWNMFRHDIQHTGYYGFTAETADEEIPGDLDSDKDIDIDDYMMFRTTLGKCEGAEGYLSDADYDGDGCITYSDYRVWYGYYLNQ